MTISILYEDAHTLVVEKPQGMPVQKDPTRNRDLLTETTFMLKLKGSLNKSESLHMINRLDRPVGGLVLMAKSAKAARHYHTLQDQGRITKKYLCVVNGIPMPESGLLKNCLKKDAASNRSSVSKSADGKRSELSYEIMQSKNELSLLTVQLHTGRHHQIRVQLSHAGWPLWGDVKYGQAPPEEDTLALWSTDLSFVPLGSKEPINVRSLPPAKLLPWANFAIK